MKNSGQLILRESTKTADTSENSLTLKYTLTVCKNHSECICESMVPRNAEHGDHNCSAQYGDAQYINKCNEKTLHCADEENISDNSDFPIYSLTIASYIDGVADDERYFEDISRNKEEAERIFDIMCENTVTPETAEYILEELLSFGSEMIQYPDLSVC